MPWLWSKALPKTDASGMQLHMPKLHQALMNARNLVKLHVDIKHCTAVSYRLEPLCST